jgi:hypothetical protein
MIEMLFHLVKHVGPSVLGGTSVYQAVLRAELTRRLGVAWGPVRQGAADLAGVPRPVIEAFSQRREQIRRWLAELGCSSARAAQGRRWRPGRPSSPAWPR